MSDNDTNTATNGSGPAFTERELQLLGWAMQSLKSGPPEIDYDKLASFASMSNPRSASNAWAKIKGKLMNPDSSALAITTPKKGGAKKKTALTPAPATNGEEGEATSKKKSPRKRTAKKQDVDGDASPKKKGRGKKASDDETNVKVEPDESQDLNSNSTPVKAEAAEENVEDEV